MTITLTRAQVKLLWWLLKGTEDSTDDRIVALHCRRIKAKLEGSK